MSDKPKRVREQTVVYLDSTDRDLLARLATKTGLAKTELFRRGLRLLAGETLGEAHAGRSLHHLVATAASDGYSANVAEHHDEYLYGGGYTAKPKKKGARVR